MLRFEKILISLTVLLVLLQAGLLVYSQQRISLNTSQTELARQVVTQPTSTSTTNQTVSTLTATITPSSPATSTNPVTSTTKRFSGLFFGDLMLDRYVGTIIKKIGVAGLLKNLNGEANQFLRSADIVSANLEGAVTAAGVHQAPQLTNDFAFNPKDVASFQANGFNFFNLANNHLTDQGQLGVTETYKNLTSLGLAFSGCPDRQVGECTGSIKTLGETKVAMLGFSMVYGQFDLAKAKAKIVRQKNKQTL